MILTSPCSNRWDDMQPAGAHRYCHDCEKHIVDLTNKSDAELIQFFRKKKDDVCGRLSSTQLNRELVSPPSKAGWRWLLPLAMSAVVFTPSKASELRPVIEQGKQAGSLSPVTGVPASVPSAVSDTIRGRVLDAQTGAPLKRVKVRQKGFENVVAFTDDHGRFEMGGSTEKSAVFIFDLDGYQKVELTVKDGMEVKLWTETKRTIMLGGIHTVSVDHQPLYVVYAGKQSCTIDPSRMNEIKPEWIEKVEILKDAKAAALYGSKGANGVILIGIKAEHTKKIDFSKKK